jgi:ankyrin repeat protein
MSALIDGVSIKVGVKEYIVPALNFKQIRTLMPKIQQLTNIGATMNDEQMDNVFTVIHAAISRNYPEINKEFLEENIDMNNVRPIINAIMGQSGLVKASGEATAGNP